MSAAQKILQRQFRDLGSDSTNVNAFSVGLINDDIFKWRVTILGPSNTPYENGVFPAILEFPEDYPNNPPKMKFICPMYHPNIRETGEVCISILHTPGEDIFEYEDKSERWLPIHTVESILLSVISMLSDPNCESPENVEAAKTFKNDQREYYRKVRKTVEQSIEYC